MAKTGGRETIHLQSSESSHVYSTTKNRRNTTERMRLKKYDPIVRKHIEYVEKK